MHAGLQFLDNKGNSGIVDRGVELMVRPYGLVLDDLDLRPASEDHSPSFPN